MHVNKYISECVQWHIYPCGAHCLHEELSYRKGSEGVGLGARFIKIPSKEHCHAPLLTCHRNPLQGDEPVRKNPRIQ